MDDEQVVARVLAGEKAWFEVLLRRHNQRLFRVARAIVKNDAEAEDVVQQAWLSAYSHLAQFESAARFSTWLTRIAVNEALGRLQRGARRGEVEGRFSWSGVVKRVEAAYDKAIERVAVATSARSSS